MREEPLRIEDLGISNGKHTLKLIGPLTISTLFDFQNLVRATAGSMLVDMTQVPYIDSAGIGALVGAYVNRQKDGRSLALAGVTDRVRGTMQVTRVEQFFQFYETVAAAQAAAGHS